MLGTRVTSRGLRQQARTDASDAVRIQRDASGPGTIRTLPPSVDEVLRSPGQALGAGQQRALHARMGFDFSGIRIHDDARAAASARELSAHAYTMGEHVVFGAGRYAPGSASGERLLRHELAHVVQQRQGRVPGRGVVTDAGLEGEADRVADGAPLVAGTGEGRGEAPAQALQRDADDFYEDSSALAARAPAENRPEREVVVDVVPVGDISPGVINRDFRVANQIYNPYGLGIKKGMTDPVPHPVNAEQRPLRINLNHSLDSDPRLSALISNRSGGQNPTTIWARHVSPSSRRGQVFAREGVCVINAAAADRDTFAHELGHLLIREGHIKFSPQLVSTATDDPSKVSMDPKNPTDPRAQLNLMSMGRFRISSGEGDLLTTDQLELVRKNKYVRRRKRP